MAYINVPLIEVDLPEGDVCGGGETVEFFFVAQSDSLAEVGLSILKITLDEGLKATHISRCGSKAVATLQRP